jgi:hypothetical protein
VAKGVRELGFGVGRASQRQKVDDLRIGQLGAPARKGLYKNLRFRSSGADEDSLPAFDCPNGVVRVDNLA